MDERTDRAMPQTRLALPRVLSVSRVAEMKRLWEAVIAAGGGPVDGSAVVAVDSSGVEMFLKGIEALRLQGIPMEIVRPSEPLAAARRALRLRDRIPFAAAFEEETGSELGQKLGEALVSMGKLEQADLIAAVAQLRDRPEAMLGTILMEKGYCDEDDIAHALARQNGLPFVKPVTSQILDVSVAHDVPFPELRVHGILPFLRLDDALAVAVKDPSDVYATDVVRKHTGMTVVVSVSSAREIEKGLDLLQRAVASSGEPGASEVIGDETPVEERFEALLVAAIIEGASDIHIEPCDGHYDIRYRVDGQLRKANSVGKEEGSSLTAYTKVTAGADISEKRLPQDGRIRFTDSSRDVDIRVSTLPTVYGEKTVMRVIDRKAGSIPLEALGIQGQNLEWLRRGIHSPHGMVLVTGPTGSGKTTTLYSVLDEIVGPEINVSTVENPVERAVKGVNQTQVNHKAGLTFELCLRALLRQDPDVIMIGEIRDHETAEIAVEAALTGHLVLATLHTNDAPGAASRLIQMGIEPFLVAATLRCVMAQRLIRRICEACASPVEIPSDVLHKYRVHGLNPGPKFKANGCPACRNRGYDKRVGVYEVLQADHPEIMELVSKNASGGELREKAMEVGMISLLTDALRYVNKGVTTLEEAIQAGGAV